MTRHEDRDSEIEKLRAEVDYWRNTAHGYAAELAAKRFEDDD